MGLRREPEVVRLTFGEDWIEVRSERKYRDTVEAQRAAATRVQAATRGRRGSEAAAQFDFDMSAFNLALLTNMIVAWSDDAPINTDTVQELPDDIVQEVLEVILGGGRTEEEEAPLERTSTSPSEQPEASGRPETPEEQVGHGA